jgi:purine-binding chemotaxis protein CheW
VKGPAYRSQKESAAPLGTGGVAQWVVFTLDSGRYALALAAVERIVHAAQITPLPGAPQVVLGVLNVQGSVLPVFSLRRRLALPERAVEVGDQFLIARTAHRRVALVIDAAQEVIEHPPAAIVDTKRLARGLDKIQGVIPLEGGMLLIQDLERLLSPEDAAALDEAMKDASL